MSSPNDTTTAHTAPIDPEDAPPTATDLDAGWYEVQISTFAGTYAQETDKPETRVLLSGRIVPFVTATGPGLVVAAALEAAARQIRAQHERF